MWFLDEGEKEEQQCGLTLEMDQRVNKEYTQRFRHVLNLNVVAYNFEIGHTIHMAI